MPQSDTASGGRRLGRSARTAFAAAVLAAGGMAGLPPALAISPPSIDPAAVPPDGPPGPLVPMRQNASCAEVGVLPETDFRTPPKYMGALNIQEAWRLSRGAGVRVAVIDTGVAPHRRLPRLMAGGDYVGDGDGLSDCDAHGTIVASMIAATPSDPPPPAAVADGAPSPDTNAPEPDAFSGIAPDVELISIRQTSQAFRPSDSGGGDQDPQTVAKTIYVDTLARAIVHAADMGASVITVSDVICMSARTLVEQRALGAAVRYAAVDRNALIVAAAGDTTQRDCRQNPLFDPLRPKDPRDWEAVNTVVTPSWFSDFVLSVGAVGLDGRPPEPGAGQGWTSVAGPWVGVAAPGVDVIGLSPRDDGLINAIEGPDNTLLVPAGTSFSAAIVSGVAALVRSRFPQLSAYQVANRLTRTARPPARGVDNQIGYGVVDPVAALTWDVPEGPVTPPQRLSAPLTIPQPEPPRDLLPVRIALGGLAGALLVGAAALVAPALTKRLRLPR